MDGGLRSDCLPHQWFLLFSFILWPPVSISDKSHSHKNLMKRLGKGTRARTHRLKACVKFGEGQVMPDIHSYQLQPRSIGRKMRCREIWKRREASWRFSWQTGNETGRSKRKCTTGDHLLLFHWQGTDAQTAWPLSALSQEKRQLS